MTIEQLAIGVARVANLPADEARFAVEKGLDSTNDKAVWVYITLQHWPDFLVRQQLRDAVREYVQEAEGVDYVYVRFQDADELAALKTTR